MCRKYEDKIVYEVCFNDETLTPIYTNHIIDLMQGVFSSYSLYYLIPLYFLVFAENEKTSIRHFTLQYSLIDSDIEKLYNFKNQLEVFEPIFGKDVIINSNRILDVFFSRNHLTPKADFTSAESKKLTYNYHNTFPGNMKIQNLLTLSFSILVFQFFF